MTSIEETLVALGYSVRVRVIPEGCIASAARIGNDNKPEAYAGSGRTQDDALHDLLTKVRR